MADEFEYVCYGAEELSVGHDRIERFLPLLGCAIFPHSASQQTRLAQRLSDMLHADNISSATASTLVGGFRKDSQHSLELSH